MLFLYFSREKPTFNPSLPDFTSNNIQPEQTYISHGSFLKIVNGKNYGLDASCRVYRKPYWEEPTEGGGFRFLFLPAFDDHTTFCYTGSTKKLGGVDHQASFFSHIGIPPSFPFSFLPPVPERAVPPPPHPFSLLSEEKKRAFMQDKRYRWAFDEQPRLLSVAFLGDGFLINCLSVTYMIDWWSEPPFQTQPL